MTLQRAYVDEADYDRAHGLDVAAPGLLGEQRAPSVVRDPLLAGVRDGSWLDAQDFPALRYAVPGVVPEGFTLLVGAPKIGKSWATLDMALGLACGGVAFGRIPLGDPRPVLVNALEDSDRRMQSRCRRLLGDRAPIPARFEFLTRIEPGRVFETIAAWFVLHADEHATVVLDTLGKVMPPALPGESSYQRDYRIGSTLKEIVDQYPGSSLVVNHHDRKAGGDDFIDAVSGTHGLAGAADTTVVLARNRHETNGLLKVTGRDVAEGEYAVKIVDGVAWMLDGFDLEAAARQASAVRAAANLGDRSADVLAFVVAHPDGVTPSQVEKALDLADARTYLKRLADGNRINKAARGLYVPLSHLSRVSQATDQRDTCDGSDTLYGDHERARARGVEAFD